MTQTTAIEVARIDTAPAARSFHQSLTSLDTLVADLQRTNDSYRQLRILLRGLLEGLGADVVFLHSLVHGETFESLGDPVATNPWCRGVLERLLRLAPANADHFIQPTMSEADAWNDSGSGHPRDEIAAAASFALVRLSKSRATWVVAIRWRANTPFDQTDLKLMTLARRLLLTNSRHVQAAERLKETLLGLIRCLSAAIDAKDPYTCGHSERVARIATRLGQEMRLPEAILSDLYLAGLLHDVGKIGIEDCILRKPGRLTDEESRAIQAHPVIGERIISSVRPLSHLRPGVRNHHERFDGEGYPDGLSGLAIPLLARVLAVADSCDAMMSARPYRPALAPIVIEETLSNGAGAQWDPQVVEAFHGCRNELYGIYQRGMGDSLYLAVGHAVDGAVPVDRSIQGNLFFADSRPASENGAELIP